IMTKTLCGGDGWAPFLRQGAQIVSPNRRSVPKNGRKFFASESDSSRLVTVQSQAEQTALEGYLSRQNAFDLATLEYLWLDGSDEQYDPHLLNNTYDSSVFAGAQNERNQNN
ncbi:hypothetical protein TYRP_023438, partial [Tyrophagus putrescentiae]